MNHFFNPNESDEERRRRAFDNMAREYFNIRAEMKKLDAEIQNFNARSNQFILEFVEQLSALVIDFYPDMQPSVLAANNELTDLSEFIFEDASEVCAFDIDPEYRTQNSHDFQNLEKTIRLTTIDFSFQTGFDKFKGQTSIPKYREIMEVIEQCFEEEYVNGFYLECLRKHIHLLLKKMLPQYLPEIFKLSAEGFRKLDIFLYWGMVQLWDVIVNAEPEV